MADRTSTVRVDVVTDASSAGASLGKFGKLAATAAIGVGAVAVGGALAANKLYEYADAQDDANASIKQGLKTMKLFGKHTGEVTARVIDQAEAISKATAVDITSIKTTQAKLLTFKELAKSAGNVNGQFNRATKAAIDLAAKGFGTAETNAVMLGKALNDPIKGMTALNKAGVSLTETEAKRVEQLVKSNQVAEAQTIVLGAVEKQVKGTAEATAGGFEKMKNRVSLFAQELGGKALPYLDGFGMMMTDRIGPAVGRFGSRLGDVVIPKLRQVSNVIQTEAVPALRNLALWINDHVVPAYRNNLAAALDGARIGFRQVTAAVDSGNSSLKDLHRNLGKVAAITTDVVGPSIGGFARHTLALLGNQIAASIAFLSAMQAGFNGIATAIQFVIDKVAALIAKINAIPSLSGIEGFHGSGVKHDPDGRIASRGGVTINLSGIHTDPRGTAREVEKVLRRAGLAGGQAA